MTKASYDELSAPTPSLANPAHVLTVGAHPDDAEFGAGATLARWADDGAKITMCVVTDGSKGSWNPEEDQAGLVRKRIAEQDAAAGVLGASSTRHLGYVDGDLEYTTGLRLEIAALIREIAPDVVLTHDPWQRYQMHPDHRAVGLATCDAVVSAREPLAMQDSTFAAHRPEALLLWSADAPDHVEPSSDQHLAAKIDALLCHSSQAETTMNDADNTEESRAAFADEIVQWQTRQGKALEAGPAETFKRITP